jgi:hypothetical protein
MSDVAVSANRLELLQIADAVAREKSIDKMVVIEAMQDAIQRAAKSRYGAENDIRAEIDPQTGETKLYRLLEVVEHVENDATQITMQEALERNPGARLGDFLSEPLPPVDFGRIAAQNAKQVIVQKVRDAERERQFEEYKDRVGEIVSGVVKRAEYGNIIVDLGRGEGIVFCAGLHLQPHEVDVDLVLVLYVTRPESLLLQTVTNTFDQLDGRQQLLDRSFLVSKIIQHPCGAVMDTPQQFRVEQPL